MATLLPVPPRGANRPPRTGRETAPAADGPPHDAEAPDGRESAGGDTRDGCRGSADIAP